MQLQIEGLDCPNCAKALEGELNKLSGINEVKIDFIKSSLSYSLDEGKDENEAILQISKLTKKLEPQAKIIIPASQKALKNQKISNNSASKSKDTQNLAIIQNQNNDQNQENLKLHKNFAKTNPMFVVDLLCLCLGICLGLVVFFANLPIWAFWTIYAVAALLLGWKTYYKALTQLFRGVINENLLITISVVGASIVSQHMEGLMVIALYSIGKIFESLAVNRSRKSIEGLVKMQPEYANLISENGKEEKVAPSEVKIGATIIIRAGEKVPLDGIITKGQTNVDMASLTGESVPVALKEGDQILSGAVVLDGVVEVQTTKEYDQSTIKKIMNLIENASQNKSKTQTFISKITKWYTLGIVALAITVFGIVFAVTQNANLAVYRGLIFLVISCPCAFAISVPLSYFSGLGNASSKGVLIKGSNYLDACSRLDTVIFDKTGTLTTGNFSIDNIQIQEGTNLTADQILTLAAIGEQYSLHPLAKAITSAAQQPLPKAEKVKELAGKGVSFVYKNNNYFVGRGQEQKNTNVDVYQNDIKLASIFLTDTIKQTSASACQTLKNMGIKTIMLSGDNEEAVNKVSQSLNLDESFSKLLPEEKYQYIEKAKLAKSKIGYVGDGINDAPSLVLADVGISMGINGSPASVEASDIVLVDDDPQKVATAIKISKFTRRIVLENIILSAAIKIIFLALGSFGVTGMLSAVFADVGVTLLAILNSMRALKYSPKEYNHKSAKKR